MKISRILLQYRRCFQLTLLITYTSMSTADPEKTTIINRSSSSVGWRLSIRTDKLKYSDDDTINLTVTLTNQTSHAASLLCGALLNDYSITLRRDDIKIPLDSDAIRHAIDGGAHLQDVPPGKGLKNEVNIREIIDKHSPLKSGHYSLEIERDFRDRFSRSKTAPQKETDLASASVKFEILSR